MTRQIAEIEGIGEKYAAGSYEVGISAVEYLLRAVCNHEARQKLAGNTRISERRILDYVCMSDRAS